MRQALVTPLAWTLPSLLGDPAAALHRTLPQQQDALPAPPNPTLLSATCIPLMAQKPIAHHSASDVDTAEASAARRSLISAVLRRPLRATSCTPGAEVIHATGCSSRTVAEQCGRVASSGSMRVKCARGYAAATAAADRPVPAPKSTTRFPESGGRAYTNSP